MPEHEPTEPVETTEPTTIELTEACAEKLSPEACNAIAAMLDIGDAIGLAFSCLIEAGVDDPEKFLVDKGIFQ